MNVYTYTHCGQVAVVRALLLVSDVIYKWFVSILSIPKLK